MLLVYVLPFLALFTLSTGAQAAELDLSMTGSAGYDSNVFRTNNNEKDDASFRFGPTIRVRNADKTLSHCYWSDVARIRSFLASTVQLFHSGSGR